VASIRPLSAPIAVAWDVEMPRGLLSRPLLDDSGVDPRHDVAAQPGQRRRTLGQAADSIAEASVRIVPPRAYWCVMDHVSDSERHHAVAAAYAAHADDVYRLAYAILRDPDEAVDATQDVFVRAFERWDRYDPQRPLRPWLHAITSRLSLDRLRRRRVRRLAIPVLAQEAASQPGPYSGRDPAVAVSRHESIEAALAALQPIPRAAVLLRHRYGYDYAEIGALLGLTTTNVGSVLSRARATLRARLADDFPPTNRLEEQA